MNSIDYPTERVRPRELEQPGYTGKQYYAVSYGGQTVTIRCADATAALFYAAKHWGFSFRRPEYHQTAKAVKLGYKPGSPFK